MSALSENKQLIHVASEIVVLVGLTFYFNQKNKKLMNHIEDLAQRLEEQEDLLQKHEEIIKKLVQAVNSIPKLPMTQGAPVTEFSTPSMSSKASIVSTSPTKVTKEILNNKQHSKQQVKHPKQQVDRSKQVESSSAKNPSVRVSFTTEPKEVYSEKPTEYIINEDSNEDSDEDSDEDENLDSELVEELAELSTDDMQIET
jgi:hypothetical protein